MPAPCLCLAYFCSRLFGEPSPPHGGHGISGHIEVAGLGVVQIGLLNIIECANRCDDQYVEVERILAIFVPRVLKMAVDVFTTDKQTAMLVPSTVNVDRLPNIPPPRVTVDDCVDPRWHGLRFL